MNKTKIDWCDSTWNPVTGCLHGCEYCYARAIANRFAPFELPHLTEDGVFKGINDLEKPITTECKDGKIVFVHIHTVLNLHFTDTALTNTETRKAETSLYAPWLTYLENGYRIAG